MSEIGIECDPYGKVWCLAQPWNELPHLQKEVEEYFQMDLGLAAGDVVVDVGANIGMFCLAAAARVPDLRILAFEPIPQIFSVLERNLAQNPVFANARVEPHCLALGRLGEEGVHDFFLVKRFPTNSTRYGEEKRDELAATFSMLAVTLNEWARELAVLRVAVGAVGRLLAAFPRQRAGRWVLERMLGVTRIPCRVSTLARVIDESDLEQIDLLKIDVEGAEMDVLEGIRPEQWVSVRKVVLEGNDRDGRLVLAERVLRDQGFDDIRVSRPEDARQREFGNFLLFAAR